MDESAIHQHDAIRAGLRDYRRFARNAHNPQVVCELKIPCSRVGGLTQKAKRRRTERKPGCCLQELAA